MTLNDQVLPELRRIRAELEKLKACTIHVGIQGDADSEILTIARVHEYGATIHAKNAKNLCIPINKLSYDKSPRDFDSQGLFFFKSDNGFLMAAIPKQKKRRRRRRAQAEDGGGGGERDEIELLFLLLPSVTIPERSFIRAGFDANRDRLAEVCQSQVAAIIHGRKTAAQAAEWIGGKAVDFIHEFMSDSGNFTPKGDIQKERAPSWANSPLTVTKRMFNSITWKVEGLE